jgi:putative lipoprotein
MSKPVRTIGWLALILALACVGCGASAAGSIIGTAFYRERMALPPGAIFEASIDEVSHADASSNAIATTEITSPRTPINFELTYDDKAVRSDGHYVVRGRITVDGRVWFSGNSDVPLPTGGGAYHVALLLRRAGGDAGGTPLETTRWKLRTLRGLAVTPVEPTREAWLTLDPADHRASGFAGCNQLTGDYTLEGDRLTFSRMVTTLRMCLHGMAEEEAFLKALPAVARWRISGTQLALLDKDGAEIATFEAGAKP